MTTPDARAQQIDPAQLAATVRRAQEAIAQLVAAASRAMEAGNTFSRVYAGNVEGARRILAAMGNADRETFRAAALTAYELAADLADEDGAERAR